MTDPVEALDPCPCCWGEARLVSTDGWWRGNCLVCDLIGGLKSTPAEAAAAWNCRPSPPPAAALAEALKVASREIEILREQVFMTAGRVATPKGLTSAQKKIDAALAAYEAGRETQNRWRPIETAPTDGTAIDLWIVNEHEAFRAANCHWDGDLDSDGLVKMWCDARGYALRDDLWRFMEDDGPTHWMPPPTAPNAYPEPSPYEDGRADALREAAELVRGRARNEMSADLLGIATEIRALDGGES